MTPEEMRVAIAEACGWTYKPSVDFWEKDGEPLRHGSGGSGVYLPDYLNDLNAMHDAERSLSNVQLLLSYFRALDDLIGRPVLLIHLVRATAAQRCEAFLRTAKPELFQ